MAFSFEKANRRLEKTLDKKAKEAGKYSYEKKQKIKTEGREKHKVRKQAIEKRKAKEKTASPKVRGNSITGGAAQDAREYRKKKPAKKTEKKKNKAREYSKKIKDQKLTSNEKLLMQNLIRTGSPDVVRKGLKNAEKTLTTSKTKTKEYKDLNKRVAKQDEKFLNSSPAAYGFMAGSSPIPLKETIERQTGRKLNTKKAEKSIGYKAGYMGGIMAEYALTGGVARASVQKSIETGAKQLAKKSAKKAAVNVVKKGEKLPKAVKRVSSGIAADTVTGIPTNTLEAGKESMIAGKGEKGKAFARSFALNTALDVGFGGAMEALPAAVKGAKAAKASRSSYIPKETVSKESRKVYKEYVRSNDKGVTKFAEKAQAGELSKRASYKLSDVTADEVERLKELTGIDTTGYTHSLKASTIDEHIMKRHGAEGSADRSMADINDLSRINYIIKNADNVEIAKKADDTADLSREFFNTDGSGAKKVKYTKKIDGHYYVVEAVPDSGKKKMQIVSAYIEKPETGKVVGNQKKTAHQVGDVLNAPPLTSETGLDVTVNNSIPHVKAASKSMPEEMPDARKFMSPETQEKVFKAVEDRSGVKIEFTDLPEGVEGTYKNGVIKISNKAESPAYTVMKHELTHHIETSGHYKAFADFVENNIRNQGVDVDGMIDSIISDYKAIGKDLTKEEARKEFTAKFTEEVLFNSEKSIERLARENPSLFRQVYEWIVDTIHKIGASPETRFLIDAQRKYEKALKTATTSADDVEKYLFVGAEKNKIAMAERMEADGASPEAIKRKLNMHREADGKWRFETDDSKASFYPNGDARFAGDAEYQRYRELTDKAEKNMLGLSAEELTAAEKAERAVLSKKYANVPKGSTLADYMTHPELYNKYPDMEGIKVNRSAKLRKNVAARYLEDGNAIDIDRYLDKDKFDNTLIHEVQHAVQDIEGFQNGTNTFEALKKARATMEAYLERTQDEGFRWAKKLDKQHGGEKFQNEYIDISLKNTYNVDNIGDVGKKIYANMLGEREARAAERRLLLDEESRRGIYPTYGKNALVQDEKFVQASEKNNKIHDSLSMWSEADKNTAKIALVKGKEAGEKLFGKSPEEGRKVSGALAQNGLLEKTSRAGSSRRTGNLRSVLDEAGDSPAFYNAKKYEKALRTVGRNPATGNTSYSLKTFEDGKRFVDVDTDTSAFDGLPRREQGQLAAKIIKEKYAGKVVGIDNPIFVNGRGAGEFGFPLNKLENAEHSAKMKSATELDNMFDAGHNFRNVPDGADGHIHDDVTGGFDYHDVIFKVGDRYYEGRINVKNTDRGKLFKDITKIKDVTEDISSSYGLNPKSTFLRTSSMNSIEPITQNVNKKTAPAAYQAPAYNGKNRMATLETGRNRTVNDSMPESLLSVKSGNTGRKAKQLEIIRNSNKMTDDYHVGIRDADDIKTFEEAMKDSESFFYGDFSLKDARKALKEGKVTVYSSKPIEQGGFVSTSKNMAKDYAGGGEVYSRRVDIDDIAWINGDEGQYAKVSLSAGSRLKDDKGVLDSLRKVSENLYGEKGNRYLPDARNIKMVEADNALPAVENTDMGIRIAKNTGEREPIENVFEGKASIDEEWKALEASQDDDKRWQTFINDFAETREYDTKTTGMGLAQTAENISNKGVSRGKDIQRNADAAFAHDPAGRQAFKRNVEDPLYMSKGRYAKAVQRKTDDLYNYAVKKLGIKKGSKESAAVQWYGEGFKVEKVDGKLKEVLYTLEDLKKDYSYTAKNGRPAWENIVEAEKYARKLYDEYFDRLQKTLIEIYPDVEKNVEKLEKKLADLRSGTRVKRIEKRIADAKAKGQTDEELQDVYEALEKAKDEMSEVGVKKIEREIFDAKNNKRLYKRKDYFRHFKDLQNGFFKDLSDIMNSSTDIDPRLLNLSEFTQPKSKWTGFLQKREGALGYKADAIGGLLEYIPQAEYKINIEPNISNLRNAIKELQLATYKSKNANKFIDELVQVANDLAGKTNKIDRIPGMLLGDKKGRQLINGLTNISNRIRANAVVGNFNTVLAQFFNMPNVVAYAKNPADIVSGMSTSLRAVMGDKNAKEILDKSMFLKERYLDRSMRRFNTGVLDNVNNFCGWMLEIGDKAVADAAFCTFYKQAKRKGLSELEAVLKADEMTRKSVAGRGIAEMPLSQKAKLTKLLAPFQVEVKNSVNVMTELLGKKDAAGLIALFGVSWMMNEALDVTTGRRIIFDPIEVLKNGYEEYREDGNLGEAAKNTAANMFGEILTNIPGGTYAADIISDTMGISDLQKAKLFGENDPTRYGTGNIALQTLLKPAAQAIQGKNVDMLTPALSLALPFGGKQIQRTISGMQDMGVLPDARLNFNDGINFEFGRNEMPGSYSDSGNLRFAIDPTETNYITAGTLGTWSTKQGKEYLKAGSSPLSDRQTAAAKGAYKAGISGVDAERYVRNIKAIEKSGDKSKLQRQREHIKNLGISASAKNELGKMVDKDKYVDYSSEASYKYSMLNKQQKEKVDELRDKGFTKESALKIREAVKGHSSQMAQVMALAGTGYDTPEVYAALGIKRGRNGNGPREKAEVLTSYGLSIDDFDTVKEAADRNGSGNVSIEEAMRYLDGTDYGRKECYALTFAMTGCKHGNNPYR